ncbi:Uncharacterised protein [Escherichia coli]|nr:Uncharacterised protein [Escherichia coli]
MKKSTLIAMLIGLSFGAVAQQQQGFVSPDLRIP